MQTTNLECEIKVTRPHLTTDGQYKFLTWYLIGWQLCQLGAMLEKKQLLAVRLTYG